MLAHVCNPSSFGVAFIALVTAANGALLTPVGDIVTPVLDPVLDILPSPAPAFGDGVVHIIDGVVQGLATDTQEIRNAASAYADILRSQTISAHAKPTPTSAVEVLSVVQDIVQPRTPDGRGNPKRGYAPSYQDIAVPPPKGYSLLNDSLALIANSIPPHIPLDGIIGIPESQTKSFNNRNTREPAKRVYPKKARKDVRYSVLESQLRSAIYIPPSFTYGKKKPVVLFPGTGSIGGDNFANNLIPLFEKDGAYDIVWVNVPGFMLGDAQINAEYAAYAINYINGITNRKVSVIAWSQGSLSNQWALKYWPSTRTITEDFIAVSADFKGTVNAYALCPGFPRIPCVPSVVQQILSSTFVNKLRQNGGDAAYVPTTTIYSSVFDEIVQPQTGKDASAFLKSSRAAQATNNMAQAICPGQPAGAFQTHESLLASALTWALIKDALDHDGPAQYKRLDLANVCPRPLAEGLGVDDLVATIGLIPKALINILLFFPKYLEEPPLFKYTARR